MTAPVDLRLPGFQGTPGTRKGLCSLGDGVTFANWALWGGVCVEGDPRLFQTGLFGFSISCIDVCHDHNRANGAFEVSFGLGCEDPIVLETAHMEVFKTRGRNILWIFGGL